MSVHLEAKSGEIAETVLLPGDPLRAKYIAETFLEDAVCYNQVRGMLGFTGRYRGERISVQGTGMGIPSAAIYIHELIKDYDARNLVRVGTCGAIRDDVHVRDVLLAQSACTSSSMNRNVFSGIDYAPIGSFNWLKTAYDLAGERSLPVRVGNVFTSDIFYADQPEVLPLLARYGVMAIEMETAALYTLAAKHQVNALSVLTVSDHVITGEETTSQERQTSFTQMIELALDTALACTKNLP
ncbi:purine-nucleoside phosphorylase [Paenibacillaceae bacterium]|nr:purine-nucleoside phosphorylase [Paenibacillaceae bacterium]